MYIGVSSRVRRRAARTAGGKPLRQQHARQQPKLRASCTQASNAQTCGGTSYALRAEVVKPARTRTARKAGGKPLTQPNARPRPLSLALHSKASYASRAEAVTPVRRRTARTAGGHLAQPFARSRPKSLASRTHASDAFHAEDFISVS